MNSLLATRLLGLEREIGAHTDIIWKYAAIDKVVIAQTPISKELTSEFTIILNGSPLEHFVSILPALDNIRTALLTSNSASVRIGAARNPHCDDQILKDIALGAGKASALAKTRLESREFFSSALTNGSDLEIATAYETLANNNDVFALYSHLIGNEENLLPLIGSDRRYTLRTQILSKLSYNERDRICSLLVGVLDNVVAAPHVDATLVKWLLESNTTRADASAEHLLSDRASLRMFLARLTDSGIRIILDSEKFGLVAKNIIRSSHGTGSSIGKTLDVSMFKTLRLAGLGVAEISSLIFSSNGELSSEQLVNELHGLDSIRMASFLSGQCLRNPEPGQVNALLEVRDLNEQEEISKALADDISELPWYSELLIGIPRKFVQATDEFSISIVNNYLVSELSSDSKAWDMALAMSSEWEGSLRSLTNASIHL